jgi:hypothetical protein
MFNKKNFPSRNKIKKFFNAFLKESRKDACGCGKISNDQFMDAF